MAHLKIKSGAIEMTANGGAEFIAQEREAFMGFLGQRMGDFALAAQKRREKMEAEKAGATDEKGTEFLLSGAEMEAPIPYNMRAVRPRRITPDFLKRAIGLGKLDAYLQPFDEIDIPVDTGGKVTVQVGYVAPCTARFVFKDCWDEAVMNEEATNKTGYYKSKGRKHVLEDIWPHISPEWQAIIKPRTIVEVINGERVEYADPLWLPSATDVFGPSEDGYWKDEGENFQLPIFKRERDRVKELDGQGTYPQWLRSVYASRTTNFLIVNTDGSLHNYYAYLSLGFAPGFDI